MTTHGKPDSLKQLTQTLLDPASEFGALRDAAVDMHSLFSRACGMDLNTPSAEDSRETRLAAGKAISPLDAGRCVLDLGRTVKFLRGVQAGIIEAQARFPGERVHVLYAGCGPFGTLALPLATVLHSEQVQFTLLDIHQQSLHHVKRLVDAFGLSSFMRRYVACDATVYDHGEEPPFHVLVIETMQKALTKEPQVAITLNLVPQMSEKGVLIPERITLTAGHTDVTAEILGPPSDGESPNVLDGAEAREQRVVLGVPFELSADSARAFGRTPRMNTSSDVVRLSAGAIRTRPSSVEMGEMMIFTTITVFESIELGDYESSLTYPTVMPGAIPRTDTGSIEMVYEIGSEPGLRFRDGES